MAKHFYEVTEELRIFNEVCIPGLGNCVTLNKNIVDGHIYVFVNEALYPDQWVEVKAGDIVVVDKHGVDSTIKVVKNLNKVEKLAMKFHFYKSQRIGGWKNFDEVASSEAKWDETDHRWYCNAYRKYGVVGSGFAFLSYRNLQNTSSNKSWFVSKDADLDAVEEALLKELNPIPQI